MATIEQKKNLLEELEQQRIKIHKRMCVTPHIREIRFLDEMLETILDCIETIKSDLQQSE